MAGTLCGTPYILKTGRGISLLHGMNSNKASLLVTYSEQEFVDAAVEIATAQRAYTNSRFPDAKSIATKFIEPDGKKENELFDWKSYSRDLDDLSRMMLEVKQWSSKNMHIVLTR